MICEKSMGTATNALAYVGVVSLLGWVYEISRSYVGDIRPWDSMPQTVALLHSKRFFSRLFVELTILQ